jgi:Flp pilus assembly protein TadB
MGDDDPSSSGPQMTGKKRYGDPRKNQPQESSKQARERSKREFSGGFLFFILFAWIVFFVLWLAVGSLLVAAIVFGVLLSGGIAVFNAR